jgi:hypothetical protein
MDFIITMALCQDRYHTRVNSGIGLYYLQAGAVDLDNKMQVPIVHHSDRYSFNYYAK